MRLRYLLLALAVACGGSTEPDAPPTGTYALQTIDGKPPPYTSGTPTNLYRLDSYSVTLLAGGLWQSEVNYTRIEIYSGTAHLTNGVERETGTYTFASGTLSIIDTDGVAMFAGTVAGDVMTLTTPYSAVYVFKRQ